ncbi:MAG: dihydroneopterin aldolase [Pseudomonadota bacterium]|nr:dihydroneopterin aldolase [Pseudomonadota bacterium]
MMAADYTRIFVRDYAAALRVGIRPQEKQAPQTIIINVECEAAEALRFDDLTDEGLDRAINYMDVYHFIGNELTGMGHIPLLETVAELIIGFCFRDRRIAKVRVRLEKPRLRPDAAGMGIEMYRVRKTQ